MSLLTSRFAWDAEVFDFEQAKTEQYSYDAERTTDNTTDGDHLTTYVYTDANIDLDIQYRSQTQMEEFLDWWDACGNGRNFTFYPDASLSASHTVKVHEEMKEIHPINESGIWKVRVKLIIVS